MVWRWMSTIFFHFGFYKRLSMVYFFRLRFQVVTHELSCKKTKNKKIRGNTNCVCSSWWKGPGANIFFYEFFFTNGIHQEHLCICTYPGASFVFISKKKEEAFVSKNKIKLDGVSSVEWIFGGAGGGGGCVCIHNGNKCYFYLAVNLIIQMDTDHVHLACEQRNFIQNGWFTTATWAFQQHRSILKN